VGIIGALVATVAEGLTIHRDDNLTVPLSAGLVMQLMVRFLPDLP
jgi:dolichol kinase